MKSAPTPENLKIIIDQALASDGVMDPKDIKTLAKLVIQGFGPDHSWWMPASDMPPKQMLILWNGTKLTPPISFADEEQVEFMKKMHGTMFYMRIPTPPGFNELTEAITKAE